MYQGLAANLAVYYVKAQTSRLLLEAYYIVS